MTDDANASGGDWADALTAPDGQPVVAVVFGGAAIALTSILAPAPVILSDPVEQATALGLSIVAALLVWGVGYAVTIRHASRAWKIGSLALLWGIALIAAERSLIGTRLAMETDLATVAEIDARPGLLPAAGDVERRGPITRKVLAHIRAGNADRLTTETAFGRLKLHTLSQIYLLQADQEVLDHCDRTGAAKALLAGYNRRRATRGAELKTWLGDQWLPAATKGNLIDFAERQSGASEMNEVTRIESALLDAVHERCTILARRSWKPFGYNFAFGSRADAEAFTANIDRLYAPIRPAASRLSLAAQAMRLR